MKTCPHCGQTVNIQDQRCFRCGNYFAPQQPYNSYVAPGNSPYPRQAQYVQQPMTPGMIWMPPGTHNVTTVVLLSIFIGGWVGMIVNKQVTKGLIIGLLVPVVLAVCTSGISFLVTYPLTLIDAILIANKLNRGQAVGEWEYF